jgi:hypothetical protein
MGTLRAGVASIALDPPLGAAMMGYGARTGRAEASHDALTARALYLAGHSDALLVACDLCLVAPTQADALRQRISRRTGLPAERILVSCIHTHSGPDTGFAALLSSAEPESYLADLEEAIVEVACRAHASAGPARLGLGHALARIGRNRRVADGPLDPDVLILRVDRSDGTPLAVAFAHGCHPTALGHDNLAYSADWPWAARRVVEEAFPGATALFFLGAHADVDPRTRGLLDLAIADQSVGVSFEETGRLGREIGETVAEAAVGIEPEADARIACQAQRIDLPVHGGELGETGRTRRLEAARGDALEALGMNRQARVRTAELFRLEQQRTEGLPDAERRERIARVRLYLRDRTAARFAFAQVPSVETQVLHIGEARLLALPLEPTVAVGLDWKGRQAGAPAAVLGIANGWMRYLPHADDFAHPEAHLHYEILQSTLVPEAAGRLLEAAEKLSAELAP